MTQLFETNAYDAQGSLSDEPRHLRSIPTSADVAERSVQWQLDDTTIETARRGIAMARQALKDSAKSGDKPNRKAA